MPAHNPTFTSPGFSTITPDQEEVFRLADVWGDHRDCCAPCDYGRRCPEGSKLYATYMRERELAIKRMRRKKAKSW